MHSCQFYFKWTKLSSEIIYDLPNQFCKKINAYFDRQLDRRVSAHAHEFCDVQLCMLDTVWWCVPEKQKN